jgi:hypothetical protein
MIVSLFYYTVGENKEKKLEMQDLELQYSPKTG